ncbi:MAG: DUF1385 domain-containing protein [Clostridiales bacterium]|nr:DUF1385 domain-containing protein [Clostridiales bacterium]
MGKDKKYYGGQAVIEGVMMKGTNLYATAVRTPEGDIAVDKRENETVLGKYKLFSLPIFRGMSVFLDSLVIGTKILMNSAVIAGEEEEEGEPSKFEKKLMDKFGDKLNDVLIYASVAVSVVIALLLFFMLPVWIGNFFADSVGTYLLGVVEGLIRICIFLIYIYAISRMKEIQRVYQYHGAEHKTINCYEAGEALTPENVLKHTRLHRRCGTSFMLIVMAVSMIVFIFIRTDNIWIRLVSRILLVPFISGISYEIIRWAGRSDSSLVKIISAPGLCLQKLTTAEPDESQIECAIAALVSVLRIEEPDSIPFYRAEWRYLPTED